MDGEQIIDVSSDDTGSSSEDIEILEANIRLAYLDKLIKEQMLLRQEDRVGLIKLLKFIEIFKCIVDNKY